MGHAEFRASNGWLQKLKKRNKIIFLKICGKSASVDEKVCDKWKDKLSEQTEWYEPKDIFNVNETGLFYKCLLKKTLSFKGDKYHCGENSPKFNYLPTHYISFWLFYDKKLCKLSLDKKYSVFIQMCFHLLVKIV